MPKIYDPEHLRARAGFVGQEAERWKAHHSEAFSRLANGTTVMIDISSGDYVSASSWHAALDAFEQKFGSDDRLSHSFTVGRPIFVGGGLWRK